MNSVPHKQLHITRLRGHLDGILHPKLLVWAGVCMRTAMVCSHRSDTPTRFRAQSSSILPFISGLRRKGRLDLYSVTHWTKKRFTVTRRTPRRIRPAVRTAWTELQARRKVLVLNEKQRTANQSNGLIFYQVVATGFEPATSRSRTRRSHN